MKKILLLWLLTAVSYSSYAQTFKITDVNSVDKETYDNLASHALGKNVIVTFYDKSVSIKLPEEKPLFLRKVDNNFYSERKVLTNGVETETTTLKVYKTLGIISSIEVSFNIAENAGQYRNKGGSLTAKRF